MRNLLLGLSAVAALLVASSPTAAQLKSGETKPAAPVDQNVSEDQALGKKFRIKADELPKPKATPAVSNGPLALPFEAQAPIVPNGFTATLFAKLEHPRRLLVLPNGDVIVAEQKPGHLTLLRAADGAGKAEYIERHAEGFNQPYGLAWRDGHILVADQDGVWKVPHVLGNVRTGHGPERKAAEEPPDQRKPSRNFNGQEMITQKGVFGIVPSALSQR